MTWLESNHPVSDATGSAGLHFHKKFLRDASSTSPPGVAIIGVLGATCNKLIDVCQHQGIYFRIFPNVQALAGYAGPQDLGLALVVADVLEDSCPALFDILRSVGAQRAVLVGPNLESAYFPVALDAGFDEVWPDSTGLPALRALVKKAWHATMRMSRATQHKVPSLGAMVLHPESCSCTIQGTPAYLSRSCFVVLQCLVTNYPEPVSRTSLFTALGKIVPGLDVRSRAVDMAVYRLRKQLSLAGVHNLEVRTIEHVGYGLTLGLHPLQ